MLVDPWGEISAELGDEEELLHCELKAERISEVREQLPALKNIRLL